MLFTTIFRGRGEIGDFADFARFNCRAMLGIRCTDIYILTRIRFVLLPVAVRLFLAWFKDRDGASCCLICVEMGCPGEAGVPYCNA